MLKQALFVALVAAAACGGGKKSAPALTADWFGKTIAVPGPAAALRPGMSVDEARKVAAAFVPKEDDYDSFDAGPKNADYGVGLSDDMKTIERITLSVPLAARATVDAAWGAPLEGKCLGNPCWRWFNTATSLMVNGEAKPGPDGEELELEFVAYSPAEKLFAATPGGFTFATSPLVGATLDEVAKLPTYRVLGDKQTSHTLSLPPTEWEDNWTSIGLHIEANKVIRVFFDVKFDPYPAAKAAFIAARDKAWGPGTPTKTIIDDAELYWFDPAKRTRTMSGAGFQESIKFEVTPYLPLKDLLGAAGPTWGFETKPILGATWAELRAAYPQFTGETSEAEAEAQRKKIEGFVDEKLDDKLGAAKASRDFQLPGTEYASFTLIHMSFDEADKVKSYRFSVDYRANPAAKADILAAIRAKFGGGREYEEYGRKKIELSTSPKIELEDSEISKAFQFEVGE